MPPEAKLKLPNGEWEYPSHVRHKIHRRDEQSYDGKAWTQFMVIETYRSD